MVVKIYDNNESSYSSRKCANLNFEPSVLAEKTFVFNPNPQILSFVDQMMKHMTKRTRNGRKRSCKTSCLTCTFFSICKLLLYKKIKKKKKKIVAIRESFFPLQMKCFLIFAKVFYAKFVPKITIRENVCQKFRDFLILRKFLLAKVSAPKVSFKYVEWETLNWTNKFLLLKITTDPRYCERLTGISER